MNCKLIKDIKATCLYNPGGISDIYLLDIRDFITYRFKGDNLYENAYVDAIFREYDVKYMSLQSVDESNFTEEKSKGVYAQTLSTFVHTLDAEKLESLLLAEVNRYVVVFKTLQDTWFTFGSDGGASVKFTQITGQVGETNGYAVTITMESDYPLFEAAPDILSFKFNEIFVPEYQCELDLFIPDMNNLICEMK